MRARSLAATLLVICGIASARAEIHLTSVLSDHAVLQRERPIHLWGSATPKAHLIAHFHNQSASAFADARGYWSLYLKPEPAGGPYVLTLTGDGPQKDITDLLVGDVWFASGQSNMEMPLDGFPPTAFIKNADHEIAAATNPNLRLLLVQHKSSDLPVSDVSATWTTCTPQTARRFSAVAYFFGRQIAASEHVPIGLIDSSWGGTPADSWVSLDELGTNPDLLPAFASRALFARKQSDLAAQIRAEKAEDDAATAAGRPAPPHPWHPDETSWLPAGLYNGMIAPFVPLEIKGFLWYQGESNSGPDRAPYYGTLFTALIADWRSHFAQGNLPFLFVQISSFLSPSEDWGELRDAQRRTLAVSNTAMAVTLDIGQADNVHPPDKQTVAARLALAAQSMVYGQPVAYQGPLFRQATTETTADGLVGMRVWFDYAAGLNMQTNGSRNARLPIPVDGFELAGEDHTFVPAQATIDGETILVQSADMPHPLYVRYGWQGVIDHNLFNKAGLPASTFSSETNPVN